MQFVPRVFFGRLRMLLPGIILTLATVVVAYAIAKFVPIIGGESLAMLLGIGLSLTKVASRPLFTPGLKWSEKYPIEVGVAIIGLTVGWSTIQSVGLNGVLYIVVLMLLVILSSLLIGKLFGLDKKTRMLLGAGSAVCGTSAIAAVTPIVGADDQQRRSTSAIISLTGVVILLFLPSFASLVFGNHLSSGALLGGTLPSIGQAISGALIVGNQSGVYGILFKMMRVLLLPIVAIIYAFTTDRKQDQEISPQQRKSTPIIPWFILLFVLFAFINSIGILPASFVLVMRSVGVFLSVTNLAAIGLNMKISDIKSAKKLSFAVPIILVVQISMAFGLIKLLF